MVETVIRKNLLHSFSSAAIITGTKSATHDAVECNVQTANNAGMLICTSPEAQH